MRCRYANRGDFVKANLCKWLLNSLAGKFGQRSHRWQKETEVDWPEPWGRFDIVNAQTGKVKHYRSLAWMIEREEKPGEHPESFPAVAAFVTSLARIKMLNLLELISNAGRIYYSAVDSIHCCHSAYEHLKLRGAISSKIGGIRLERVGSKAEYRGIANYSIDGELHVAGLSRTAKAVNSCNVRTQSIDIKIPTETTGGHTTITET